MHGIVCDRCGSTLLIDSEVRYLMRLTIQAAYDPLEVTRQDLERDLEGEMRDLVDRVSRQSETTLEHQVHFEGRYDLCPPCQRRILADPLFQGEA